MGNLVALALSRERKDVLDARAGGLPSPDWALLLFAQSSGLGLRAHPVSPAGHEPGVDENEGVSE